MSIILADYPAYTIIEPRADKVWKHGERFMLPRQTCNHGTVWSSYTLGSVVSYAMQYNNDPVQAVDRARANGHRLHWANHDATVISSNPPPKHTRYGLQWGDYIKFEGRIFQLQKAPNDNVSLVEVPA